MSEIFSTQRPVMAAMHALQQMTNASGCFSICSDPQRRGDFEQSLGTIYTELGHLFFEETGPSELGHFTNETIRQGICNPGILLTELIRNFMLAYADNDHQGSARAVFEELDAIAQSVRERRAPALKVALSELDDRPPTPPSPTAKILPFKTRPVGS
ncbi:hypothetical protein BLL42_27435 (plasmid) [Pseudomonas frederiksbergensis]|uniref:Uncharacterized protein n=1 Tax=Pseudomonas frederiksbergensis TaxID=104087 RepID=A0A1J0ETZ9_9PSED|nr:hypothetical protein [Pseudomonas frederiksbergensis]APC19470.1 hypothetical protein BLL42_27435 [Pseudomonas frederiksbergensis]